MTTNIYSCNWLFESLLLPDCALQNDSSLCKIFCKKRSYDDHFDSKSKFQIVEVKGPNDKLSTKQILWLDFFMRRKASVEVCYVKGKYDIYCTCTLLYACPPGYGKVNTLTPVGIADQL